MLTDFQNSFTVKLTHQPCKKSHYWLYPTAVTKKKMLQQNAVHDQQSVSYWWRQFFSPKLVCSSLIQLNLVISKSRGPVIKKFSTYPEFDISKHDDSGRLRRSLGLAGPPPPPASAPAVHTHRSQQTTTHDAQHNQSISLFASKYTYLNIVYVNGRLPEKHRVQLAGDL